MILQLWDTSKRKAERKKLFLIVMVDMSKIQTKYFHFFAFLKKLLSLSAVSQRQRWRQWRRRRWRRRRQLQLDTLIYDGLMYKRQLKTGRALFKLMLHNYAEEVAVARQVRGGTCAHDSERSDERDWGLRLWAWCKPGQHPCIGATQSKRNLSDLGSRQWLVNIAHVYSLPLTWNFGMRETDGPYRFAHNLPWPYHWYGCFMTKTLSPHFY